MSEPDISEYVLWDGFKEVPGETRTQCLDCLREYDSSKEHDENERHRAAVVVIRRNPDSMLRTKEQLERMKVVSA